MQTSISLSAYNLAEMRFDEIVSERGYKYSSKNAWEVVSVNTAQYLKKNQDFLLHFTESSKDSAMLYATDELVALADFAKRSVTLSVAGSDLDTLNAHVKEAKKFFPQAPDNADDRVKVRFWYNTNHGPRNVNREIVVPKWENISQNYTKDTGEELNSLINDFHPTSGGQLLIFYGAAGLGKSYSLRALIRSWSDWCTAEYVLDPENLFGANQGYMADLVLKGRSEYDPEEDEDDPANDKWKLLILEDNGELLSADAKQRSGQGLGRLLNLVDGLIGQGLRVLVLITTNEELEKLHEAVSREGRCAAAINFKKFSRSEALRWLKDHEVFPPSGRDEFTLAELYGLTKDHSQIQNLPEIRKIGFSLV